MGRRKRRVVIAAVRRSLAVGATMALLLALPAGVAATVDGGCIVTGTSSSGGTVDLTGAIVWHVRSADRVTVSASAPFEQTETSVSARALGVSIPLASGAVSGHDFYESSFDVATLAALGRVFVVSGSSSGPFHTCSGQFEVVIDDVNPLLTVAGAAGLVGGFVGFLGAAWALRDPSSTRRRLVGLFALALLGGGVALLLQQTSTPGEGGLPVSAWVGSVAGPGQVSLDPVVLAQSAAVSLGLLVFLPFPSELFNRTLEANLPEIRAAVRRLPLIRGLARAPSTEGPVGWRHPLAVAGILLAAAVLYGFLDPDFGRDPSSLATFLGIVASLVAVRWVTALPLRAMHRARFGDRGFLRAVPGTLLVAVGCVLVSRLASFQPGYLYGLVIGYAFTSELSTYDEGRAHAAGGWWMLGLALVAWLSLGAVRTPGVEPSLPTAIVSSVLAALVVGGVEGVAFGLLPLRFLHGEPVFRWRRGRWAILQALGLFAFFWIILDPQKGFLEVGGGTPFLSAVALFVGFGLLSVIFWAAFRFRRRPAASPVAVEAPPEGPVAGPPV